MSFVYDQAYWDKKIQSYASEEWVKDPSPFARLVLARLKPGGTVLELGAGAGQDGLWFAENGQLVIATDATNNYFEKIGDRIRVCDDNISERYDLRTLDVTKPFDIPSESVDAVYAHLILHYFDDETMKIIMREIERVLKTGGIFACLVNTQDDEEYDSKLADENDIIVQRGIAKRYFNTESLSKFTKNFETLLLDNKGRTPKDDAVGNSGMIQFIGKKV